MIRSLMLDYRGRAAAGTLPAHIPCPSALKFLAGQPNPWGSTSSAAIPPAHNAISSSIIPLLNPGLALSLPALVLTSAPPLKRKHKVKHDENHNPLNVPPLHVGNQPAVKAKRAKTKDAAKTAALTPATSTSSAQSSVPVVAPAQSASSSSGPIAIPLPVSANDHTQFTVQPALSKKQERRRKKLAEIKSSTASAVTSAIAGQPAISTSLASQSANHSSVIPTGSSAADPRAAILAEIKRVAAAEAKAITQARKDALLAKKSELEKQAAEEQAVWAAKVKAQLLEKYTAEGGRELAGLEEDVEMLGGRVVLFQKEPSPFDAEGGVIGPAGEGMGEQLGLEAVGHMDEGRGADVMLHEDDVMEGVEEVQVIQDQAVARTQTIITTDLISARTNRELSPDVDMIDDDAVAAPPIARAGSSAAVSEMGHRVKQVVGGSGKANKRELELELEEPGQSRPYKRPNWVTAPAEVAEAVEVAEKVKVKVVVEVAKKAKVDKPAKKIKVAERGLAGKVAEQVQVAKEVKVAGKRKTIKVTDKVKVKAGDILDMSDEVNVDEIASEKEDDGIIFVCQKPAEVPSRPRVPTEVRVASQAAQLGIPAPALEAPGLMPFAGPSFDLGIEPALLASYPPPVPAAEVPAALPLPLPPAPVSPAAQRDVLVPAREFRETLRPPPGDTIQERLRFMESLYLARGGADEEEKQKDVAPGKRKPRFRTLSQEEFYGHGRSDGTMTYHNMCAEPPARKKRTGAGFKKPKQRKPKRSGGAKGKN
ncbi:uncharacterized protein MKK02DRAFT_27768 [Dioszegia hungarica]|uniref:Uncharacterized protein n=1 Tax=Dioszegia hungarica TaxID=4972 RepID=A0AA38H619_9TREE|nr:uncharacterized protein MKK02DRAFT_27768 [Dioszegia hungarica]KAI9634568.1 hypothetical protein MKK02DRAFT_27768 [Dioszegia hungarica]